MKPLSLLVPLGLVGCGISSDPKFVADRYDRECRAAHAPNPDAARQLDQICTCMNRKILATVHAGESEDVINKKIDEDQQACLAEVYPRG